LGQYNNFRKAGTSAQICVLASLRVLARNAESFRQRIDYDIGVSRRDAKVRQDAKRFIRHFDAGNRDAILAFPTFGRRRDLLIQDQSSIESLGETVLDRIVKYLTYPLIKQEGSFKVSILSLILLGVIMLVSVLVSRYTRRILKKRVLPRFHVESGLQYTLLRLVHYLIIGLGVLYGIKIGLSVDLTSVAVIIGFLSVGIGFGLQYLAADIASGFILLFERPARVGDWVELDGGIEGRVQNISLRSIVVVTNENMAVILPNSKLVQNKFVNYSYGSGLVRLNIPIGVAEESDLDKVSEALLEAARSVEKVLSEPEPKVHFAGHGDSSFNLQIRVWIDEPRDHSVIQSHVFFAIERAFRKYGIQSATLKREIHFANSPGLSLQDTAPPDR
jgi:small-conductance mechanosensitive channel